ncbi:MAG: hypothetical protein GY780_15960 [bacterium]|nr:hypothetical protein [bacterium]
MSHRRLSGCNDQFRGFPVHHHFCFRWSGLIDGDLWDGQGIGQPAGFTITVEALKQVVVRDDLSGTIFVPGVTSLHGNHPNPFNPQTQIGFSLSQAGRDRLNYHDMPGCKARSLLAESLSVGVLTVIWDGTDDRGGRDLHHSFAGT